jgi:hypothetical protein
MTQPLLSVHSPAGASAEVRAHDRVVRYRRSGVSGPSLLLLAADSASDLWPEFPRLLAERFRLLMPDLPESVADATQSLRCLLDGLGSTAASVLAAGRYCDAALALAFAGHEGVGRLVLVPNVTEDAEALEEPRDARRVPAAPIYVLSRRLAVDDAIEKAIAYLA